MKTGEEIIEELTQLVENYEKFRLMGVEIKTESVWKAVENILTSE